MNSSSHNSPNTEQREEQQLGATSVNLLQQMYNPYSFLQSGMWGYTEQQLGYQPNCNHQYQTNLLEYGNYHYPQPWLINEHLNPITDTTIPNKFTCVLSKNTADKYDQSISNIYQLLYQLEHHNQPQGTVGTSTFVHILSELIF